MDVNSEDNKGDGKKTNILEVG